MPAHLTLLLLLLLLLLQVMRDALAEEPSTIFLVAAYHIGKERAFLGAALQLGCKVRTRGWGVWGPSGAKWCLLAAPCVW